MKKTRKYLRTVSIGDKVWLLPNFRMLANGMRKNLNKALNLSTDIPLTVTSVVVMSGSPRITVEGSSQKFNLERFTKDPP